MAFFAQNKAKLYKFVMIKMVFEKNVNFCRKLSKIAENFAQKIDSWPLASGLWPPKIVGCLKHKKKA
jgi:hypothetical protein